MLVVAMVALATPSVYRYIKQKPTELVQYSPVALKDQLSNHGPALVFFHARWDLQSQRQITQSSPMWSLLREESVLALSADCTSPGASGERLMRQIGISTLPAFAIYMPNDPTNPVVVPELATESTKHAALERFSRSRNPISRRGEDSIP